MSAPNTASRGGAPTPEQQLPPLIVSRVRSGWTLVGSFAYQAVGGVVVFHRALLHPPAAPPGSRAAPLRPEWHTFYSRGGAWCFGEPTPKNRVLYGLPRLLGAPPKATVYVTPDERAANALGCLGLIATTSGAELPPSGANWSLLHGRTLRLWPDQGPASADWLKQIADRVLPQRCTLYVPRTYGWGLHQGVLGLLAAAPQTRGADVAAMEWKPWPLAPADGGEPSPHSRLVTVRVSEVEPEAVQWLWPGRIALGKLTVVAGNPGMGKSLLTLALAAHVTRGTPWPVDGAPCPQGEVLLVTDEDGAADTIRPRLDAAGADGERIHLLRTVSRAGQGERMLRLQHDLQLLAAFLAAHPQVRLVCIDPLSLYLGDIENRSDSAARAILHPLAAVAGRAGAALLGVAHLNKRGGAGGADGSPLYRVQGSLALVAAARACYLAVRDPSDRERRLLLPAKNNLGQDASGFAYRVVSAGGSARIQWEPQSVDFSADEALGPDPGRDEHSHVVAWLLDLLAQGPVPARQVRQAAAGAGLSWRTIQRAMRSTTVESRRVGFGPEATYLWCLRTHRPAATPPA